jgi:hypothetical protein
VVGSTAVTARPSRRAVLRAGLALPLLVACTGDQPDPGPPPPPDPDLALHDAAVTRERVLLDAYDAALLAAPSLALRLAPLRAEHAEHLLALDDADPAPAPSGSPSPSRSPSASASAAPPPPPPPADPATVLAGLVALEAETATGHGAGAVDASRELAVVLATLAASEASHRVALA